MAERAKDGKSTDNTHGESHDDAKDEMRKDEDKVSAGLANLLGFGQPHELDC